MTPLDLAKAPPRSPQEELRGLCMLPRMIDIARAKLPGGNVGDYQIGRDKTLSAAVLDAFGISAGQFVNIVRDARTDEDVARTSLGRRKRSTKSADRAAAASYGRRHRS